jgi:N-acetylmuramoyl-L-alanine amidase
VHRHDDGGARCSLKVSLSRRRAIHWLALPVVSIFAPSVARASARAASARLWPAQEYTRIILEAPAPIAYQLTTLRDPNRLVLDLDGVELTPELSQLPAKLQGSDPYIAAIRIGQKGASGVRIVFDLKSVVDPQVFALAPVANFGHRVILDLYPLTPVDPMMALLSEPRREAMDAAPAGNAAPGGNASPNAAPVAPGTPAKSARASGRPISGRRSIIIAIDPGHGGEDPGAIGPRGTYEKNVTLAIGRKLKRLIDGDRDMRAMLTRDDDYFVPLATRVQKARQVQADLFVSVHADAFRVSTARGSSVFALSEHGATSAAARWLAQKENSADLIGGVNLDMHDRVIAHTMLDMLQSAQINDSLKAGRQVLEGIGSVNPLHKGAVEQAGFAVLKAPDIPSILVETAFISNPDEELKLRSDRYQGRFAESMHDGIRRYFAQNPPLARSRNGTG